MYASENKVSQNWTTSFVGISVSGNGFLEYFLHNFLQDLRWSWLVCGSWFLLLCRWSTPFGRRVQGLPCHCSVTIEISLARTCSQFTMLHFAWSLGLQYVQFTQAVSTLYCFTTHSVLQPPPPVLLPDTET